ARATRVVGGRPPPPRRALPGGGGWARPPRPPTRRDQIDHRNRVGDAKLIAKCLPHKLLERCSVGLPAEPADALVSDRVVHNMGTALDAIPCDRPGADDRIGNPIDQAEAIERWGIAN